MNTAGILSQQARELYSGAHGLGATLQTLRPYICPFEQILPLVPPGSHLLDAGCGAGLFLGLLAVNGRVARGEGFDSSRPAIDLAQRMRPNLPSQAAIEFRLLDATAEWPGADYDVVSLIDVIHHVAPEYQLAVLSRAIARVRPGGLLLYKDMAQRPLWRAWCNRAHDLLMVREWIHYLPIGTVDDHMARQGLRCVAKGAASRYWYAHEWRLFEKQVSGTN